MFLVFGAKVHCFLLYDITMHENFRTLRENIIRNIFPLISLISKPPSLISHLSSLISKLSSIDIRSMEVRSFK